MRVYYTEDHEWIEVSGETATIGITQYAAGKIGDVIFVELPQTGSDFSRGDEIAVVESVKAASDVYSPASGKVTAINETLDEAPETVNNDPEGEGWFCKLTLVNTDELSSLMDADTYKNFCQRL